MTFTGFVEGPLVWIAFLTFFIGSALRLLFFFTLSTKKDKPVYHYYRSKWMLPFHRTLAFPGQSGSQKKSRLFHPRLYLSYLSFRRAPFLRAHIYAMGAKPFWLEMVDDARQLGRLDESCPPGHRRFFYRPPHRPGRSVRIITPVSDYLLIIICALPFLTGYLNAHPDGTIYQWATALHTHLRSIPQGTPYPDRCLDDDRGAL